MPCWCKTARRWSNAQAWIQGLYPDTPFSFFPSPLETFKVEEKTTSAYLMADVGEPGDRYHVNVGARVIRTELTVDQNAASNPNPTFWGTDSWNGVLKDFTTVTFDRSYTDILPSANLVLDVTETSKVRFSAARVMARQDLFQLGRGFEQNFTRDTNPGPNLDKFRFTNGSTGNPDLDPYRAIAVRPELRVLLRRSGIGRSDAVLEGGRLVRHGRDAVDLRHGRGRRPRGTGAGSGQRRGRRHQGYRAVRAVRIRLGPWLYRQLHVLGLRIGILQRCRLQAADPGRAGARIQRHGLLSELRVRSARVLRLARQVVRQQFRLRRSDLPRSEPRGGHHPNVRHLESRLLPGRCADRLPVHRQARCDARRRST